jgi:purine-binding chemotaxis protein CheW
MTLLSSLRSRRSSRLPTTQRISLIVFRLSLEWFALPIEQVERVIPLETVYGDPQGTGISLTRYQNQEVMVLDVGVRIFADAALTPSLGKNFLVILAAIGQDSFGIPVESPPSLRRVEESSFTPLPDSYLWRGNIHCLSSNLVHIPDHPAVFLLDINQLLAIF